MTALLIGQFLIYALAWGLAAVLLREGRRPLLWWCAYCALQAAGLQLMSTQPPGTGLGVPAAIIILLAYTCADLGIDLFAQGAGARRPRYTVWWVGLGAASALAVALLAAAPTLWRGAAYNLGVAALLAGPMLLLHRRLQAEFGLWGLLPLLPGSVVCVFALLRTAMLITQPGHVGGPAPSPADNPALMLTSLLAAGLFNISFIGLVIGRLVRRLARAAAEDPLTRLANRSALERQIAAAWAASSRFGSPLSMAFIDVDAFKSINDRGGHEAGDQVLRLVGDVLRTHARQTDGVGRWGGDEFLLLMPRADQAAAQRAARRLREAVLAAAIPVPPGCPALTLSIGIASRQPGDATAQALIDRADAAMYEAKRSRDPDSERPGDRPGDRPGAAAADALAA